MPAPCKLFLSSNISSFVPGHLLGPPFSIAASSSLSMILLCHNNIILIFLSLCLNFLFKTVAPIEFGWQAF